MNRLMGRVKSVRTKILAGFLLLCVVTGAVGMFALAKMSAIGGKATYIYSQNLLPIKALGNIGADMQAARVSVMLAGLARTPEQLAEAKTSFEDELGALRKALDYYKTTDLSGREEALGRFEDGLKEWVRLVREEMFPALDGGDFAAFLDARERGAPSFQAGLTALGDLQDIESKVAGREEKAAEDAHRSARTVTIALVIGAVVGSIALGLWLARMIASPLKRTVEVLGKVADGDFTQRLEVTSRDEVGQMAEALNRTLEATGAVISRIRESAATLSSSSEELSATSAQLGASAEETSAQAGAVSAAAEQVSANVQTVATSAEEMSASIREIASSANEAAGVAAQAVSVAQETNATVTKLGESSAEIGEVIKVITSIAEQTNLLALNATIEAARAGEAGKGFAVVANEVKELAKQTAKATEEIGGKIVAIQSDARAAVEAIAQITEVINRINDIQGTIASAVEEQTATTNEISRNVAEAAAGATQIAGNITQVAQAAQDTSAGAATSNTAARNLASLAEELNRLVARFRVSSGIGRAASVSPEPTPTRDVEDELVASYALAGNGAGVS